MATQNPSMTEPTAWWAASLAVATEHPTASWQVDMVHTQRAWTEEDADMLEVLLCHRMGKVVEREVLEAHSDNGTVLVIDGRDAVRAFCESDVIPDAPQRAVFVERNVHTMEDHRSHYSVRWVSTVREEMGVELSDEARAVWADSPKTFTWRTSRRWHDKTNARVVYEIVTRRESQDAVVRFQESNTFSQPMAYAFAVLLEPGGDPKDVRAFLDRHKLLMTWLLKDPAPMTLEEQAEVIASYTKLIASVLPPSRERADSRTFFAPKPMTLEQRHLTTPGRHYGMLSVLSGYAVTEKADGERMQLWIDGHGDAYIINNTMEVRRVRGKVGSKALALSLIDGEFVSVFNWRGKGAARDLFLAFDAYFVGGMPVYERPLLLEGGRDRMKAVAEVVHSIERPSLHVELEIRIKEHRAADGDAMKAVCRSILDAAPTLDYDIDGLIFTPKDVPVFGVYPHQKVVVPWSLRWDRVFKWKPPEQNTIDFLVKDTHATWTCPTTRQRHRVYELYTGYNPQQWEALDVVTGLGLVYGGAQGTPSHPGVAGDTYRARRFEPLLYGHPDVHRFYAAAPYQTEQGQVLADNIIIEFAYDMRPEAEALPPARRWIPLRVREDKTRMLHTNKSLSRTANDLSVAANVWQSIHEPLTRSMLIGDAAVPEASVPTDLEERMLGSNDVYYARDMARNNMLSVHMLNFHNHGIKHMLYERIPRKESLLELACGMAGDLPRWRRMGFKFVLGMDLVRSNIVRPLDGAYARLAKQRTEVGRVQRGADRGHYPRVVFVIGDCAKPIKTGEASADIDDASAKVLSTLYRGTVHPSLAMLQRWGLAGRAASGFTGVSCQFAVHYFFKTRSMLHGFLTNVAENLKPGGAFVCTFMDGAKVHSMLEHEASDGAVVGRKGNIVVWAITRRYETFTPEDAFGKVIDVYLENTRKEIPEFLVHPSVLEAAAREVGLTLQDTGSFEETFQQLYQTHQLERDLAKLANDPVQTKFSFLNRWAVFVK